MPACGRAGRRVVVSAGATWARRRRGSPGRATVGHAERPASFRRRPTRVGGTIAAIVLGESLRSGGKRGVPPASRGSKPPRGFSSPVRLTVRSGRERRVEAGTVARGGRGGRRAREMRTRKRVRSVAITSGRRGRGPRPGAPRPDAPATNAPSRRNRRSPAPYPAQEICAPPNSPVNHGPTGRRSHVARVEASAFAWTLRTASKLSTLAVNRSRGGRRPPRGGPDRHVPA